MAHIHAALMAQYAQDALTTDTPWDLWEFQASSNGSWNMVTTHPAWLIDGKYRRKPERRWYRVALFVAKDTSWTVTADCEDHEKQIKNYYPDTRWLTDRIYYDVE